MSTTERPLHELLLRIPTGVAGQIIVEWLLITDVCKVDAAFANALLRPEWFNFLASGDVMYANIPPPINLLATIPFMLAWMHKRGIPMSTMEITPELDLVLVNQYLDLTARKLTFVSLQNMKRGTEDILNILSSKELDQLRTIRSAFSNLDNHLEMRNLLKKPHNLEELRFNYCTNIHADLFLNMSLPYLRTVSVNFASVSSKFVTAFAMSCRNLQNLNLSKCGIIDDEAVGTLARNCVQLRLISLCGQGLITDAAIVELSQCCTGLLLVDVCSCPLLTNASIVTLASNCHRMERLYMSNNENITDAALRAITDCIAPTFEVLNILDCPHITSYAIIHVIERCPKLITLYLGGIRHFPEEELPMILVKCSKIEKLSLEFSTIGDDVLQCIATHCLKMAELGLFHVEDGITEAGLLALATNCTTLETLVLCPDCAVVTSFAIQLWKMLRPELEISQDSDEAIAFDMETQMDWYSHH